MKAQHIPTGFWSDSRIVALPAEARLLMVGLICLVKDGCVRRDADQLRRQVFPDDEVPVGVFLQMLANVGLVEMDETRIRLLDYLPPPPQPKRKPKTMGSPEFEEFFRAYPRPTAKQAAIQAYNKAVPGVILHRDLMTACRKFATAMKGRDPQFVPHPATWLNQGRWDDEITDGPPPAPIYPKADPNALKKAQEEWEKEHQS